MWRERRPGKDGISTALGSYEGPLQLVTCLSRGKAKHLLKRGIDELTAAPAQSVRLVVTFTKGRGTFRYLEVSCDPS